MIVYKYHNRNKLILNSNNNNNDGNTDSNISNNANKDNEEEESIEDLVKRAQKDMEYKKDSEAAADLAKKKDVMKKRADKEYEAYWQKQKELSQSSSYKQAVANAYYSESIKVDKRNVTATSQRLAKLTDNEMLMETNTEPLSNKQVLTGAIGSLGLLSVALIAKQLTSAVSKGTPLIASKVKRYYESRIIKRDYSFDELFKSLQKSKDSGSLQLPGLPSLANLKCIRGNSNILQGNPDRIKIILLFQSTNILSLRVSAALKNLQMNSAVDIITVVSSSPNPYEVDMLRSNSKDDNGLGLLMPNEIPENIFIDEDNSLTKALKITYPGIIISLDNNILYGLEGYRVMQTGGNAIGAALGFNKNRNEGKSIADSWSSNPLLANPKANPNKLSQPTRLTIDSKNGILFVADTGNNRVLSISLNDGMVKKVYGSNQGLPGRMGDGSLKKDILFNRPMGLALDYEDNLFVADTGNDEIIKIKLDDGIAVKVSIADADIDYSGASYDSSELDSIEKTLGKTLKELRSVPAEEVQALIQSKNLDDDLLAKRLIGRSRDLIGPTDLAKADAFIYASASCSRQIWRVEAGGFIARPTFGDGLTGQSNVKDPLKFLSDLSFVEPNGMAYSSGRLFILDSGAGSLRVVNLIEGYSKNILGTGSSTGIFSSDKEVESLDNSFGDIDGPGTESKMKFASSCCALDTDRILVADTLSHKIKVVEVSQQGKSKTFIGKGESGSSLNELSYPQGVIVDRSSGKIYIADTGNNRILITDKDGKDIKEMKINFDTIV